MQTLKMLVLTDIHYVQDAERECDVPKRKCRFALELIRKTLDAVRGEALDAVALLGDLVDDGLAPGAEKDWVRLQQVLRELDIPIIVVPGNHDCDPGTLLHSFSDTPGLHRIKGYQLISFVDSYPHARETRRDMQQMEAYFQGVSASEPIVTLQHQVVLPAIDKGYPYNLDNADAVAKYYEEQGVLLSLSGHYHRGHAPVQQGGVTYITASALCESPYAYTILELQGTKWNVRKEPLLAPEVQGLFDLHVHTHFGNCADERMKPLDSLRRAQMYGFEGIACTEHAGQLYVAGQDFWTGRFVNEPELLLANRGTNLDRMGAYRQYMQELRASDLLIGLEVDVDCNGDLTLRPEDRDGWDILLGAVHWLPKRFDGKEDIGFMWANEQLLRNGVDILVHPFRFFSRKLKQAAPKELYRPLAQLLRQYNTAAEINYHINEPDLAFFRFCVEEGVPLSLGSDAHNLYEVGCQRRYFRMLEDLAGSDWQRLLYQVDASRRRLGNSNQSKSPYNI